MGEDECDPPIILGRPFLNTTKATIYIGIGEVHFQFPLEKVHLHLHSNYIIDEDPKRIGQGEGDVPATRRRRML